MILDDALRPQVIVAGVPAIVCTSLNAWVGEVLCTRELLGVIQTLTWDKITLLSVLQQQDVLTNIIKLAQVTHTFTILHTNPLIITNV